MSDKHTGYVSSPSVEGMFSGANELRDIPSGVVTTTDDNLNARDMFKRTAPITVSDVGFMPYNGNPIENSSGITEIDGSLSNRMTITHGDKEIFAGGRTSGNSAVEVIPRATTSTPGLVIVGENLVVDEDGRINAPIGYSHPPTHPANIIVQDANHRFVSDSQISTWNNKANTNGTYSGMTVGKADRLTTDRTFSLTGAVSGSATFNGSGNCAINTTLNDVKLPNVITDGVIVNNMHAVAPKGGQKTTGGWETGAIKIKFPKKYANCMFSFWVDIFSQSNESLSIFIAGCFQPARTWTDAISYQISKSKKAVRFCKTSDDHASVIIGDVGYQWYCPQIVVRNVNMGYIVQSYIDFKESLEISIVQSLDTVQQTVNYRLHSDMNGSLIPNPINVNTKFLRSDNTWSTVDPATIGAAPANHNHNGVYAPNNHNHHYSQILEAPSSMKNPNALTISLNGSSQGAYDGSSAKTINITPSSIGAYTKGEVDSKKFITSSGRETALTKTNRPSSHGISMVEAYANGYPVRYGNVLRLSGTTNYGDNEMLFGWSGSSGAVADIYFRNRRDVYEANWSDWSKIWHSNNFNPDTKLTLVNSGNKVGFQHGTAGIFVGGSNGIGFSTDSSKVLYIGYFTHGSYPVETYIFNNGNSSGGYGTIRAGNIYSNGQLVWHGGNFNPNTKLNTSGGTINGDLTVTRKLTTTTLDINIGEGLQFLSDDNYFGTNQDARIIRLIDSNDTGGTVDGGLIFQEHTISDNKSTEILRLRGRTKEIKFMGNNIWHAGNFNPDAKLNTSGGTINGALTVTGQILSNSDVVAYSDARFKTNLQPIVSALDKVEKINGYKYDMLGVDNSHQVGVIAQEVAEILPEAVYTDSNGHMGVRYTNLIPLLIEAIKELKSEVKLLKK